MYLNCTVKYVLNSNYIVCKLSKCTCQYIIYGNSIDQTYLQSRLDICRPALVLSVKFKFNFSDKNVAQILSALTSTRRYFNAAISDAFPLTFCFMSGKENRIKKAVCCRRDTPLNLAEGGARYLSS